MAKRALSLRTLTKSSVWDVQENDIFRMLESAEKDSEVKDNIRKYLDIVRLAFTVEELKGASSVMSAKYEKAGYKVGKVKISDNQHITVVIKKRPIDRVSDLTYENIHHISAAKLVEILDRNFGGGWDSLSQSMKDIIESGFEISTTTLPKERLHKHGGMYEQKVKDGYDVLEIAKGSWVEAIFVKVKPEAEKPRLKLMSPDDEEEDSGGGYIQLDDGDNSGVATTYDDEEMTEDNYRTTFEIEPDEEGDVSELEEDEI